MKKILSVVLAVMMIFAITASVTAVAPFATIDVPQCTTAPTIDGKLSAGEYKLVATYDSTKATWSRDSVAVSEVDGATAKLYATWDATNFYTLVMVTSADDAHPAGPVHDGKYYVFEQQSLMTAMVYDDPTKTEFLAATGEDWEWGDAAAATFAREWTVGKNADGVDFKDTTDWTSCDHFGTVRANADFKWEMTTADGYDVYEQAIPWAAIGKTTGIEVGGKCGYAFAACIRAAVDATDVGSFICFASGISGAKSFQRYAQVTLTANEPFEESVADESVADESQDTTPPTGDNFAIFAIVAVIALAGATVVVSKVRK